MLAKTRMPRLFLERDLSGNRLSLDEREAHYLGHVLRLQRGAELVAFNGRGNERRASVGSLQRRGAELELHAELEALPESALDFTLLQALPKADAMDLIVQKATELGVRAIMPVYSQFSVVKLDAERTERRVEHWRRIARSACEQCGRHTPPGIVAPDTLPASLERLAQGNLRVALDPLASRRLDHETRPMAGMIAAVGPEGGFGANDWRHLDAASFTHIRLGSRVLRAETAALAVCAVAQSLWGDL
jgi:16S rRNA (uracil1498-N3)-methyltransferase